MALDADRGYRRVRRWSADYRPPSKLGSLGHWTTGRDQTNYVWLGLPVSNDGGNQEGLNQRLSRLLSLCRRVPNRTNHC